MRRGSRRCPCSPPANTTAKRCATWLAIIAARYIGASGHKMLDANDDAAIGDYEIMQAQAVDGTYAAVVIGMWSSGTGELVIYND